MFNLCVSWEEDAFDSLAWVIERFRFTEYTDEKLVKRYSRLTPKARQALFSFPTLFVRESLQGNARVGYIRDARPRGNDLLVEFDFDANIPPFPAAGLSRRALLRLDVRSGELGRTHWAVKGEDLLAVLSSEGLIPATGASPAQSIPEQPSQELEPELSLESPRTTDATAPRVFVSYSWESEEHKQWVLTLATKLRLDGIDAVLDRWNLRPGSDKALFMERSVIDSNFVLIICTPTYATKANSRAGGVGYEAMVITGQLAQTISQEKFIPLLKEGSWESSTPVWLQTKLGVDLSATPYSVSAYDDLLRRLHDQWLSPPELGPRPAFRPHIEQSTGDQPLSLEHEITESSPEGSVLRISTNNAVTINTIEYLTGDNVRVSQQAVALHGTLISVVLPHSELLKVWNLQPQDGTKIILRLSFSRTVAIQTEEIHCVMRTDFRRNRAGLTLFFRLVG